MDEAQSKPKGPNLAPGVDLGDIADSTLAPPDDARGRQQATCDILVG